MRISHRDSRRPRSFHSIAIMVSCLALGCATRAGAPTATAPPPLIEFAIVEPAPDVAARPGVLKYAGETFTVRELRRFRFATAAAAQDDLGWPAVTLVFDPRDSQSFSDWTGHNVGRTIAVVIDGGVVTVSETHGRLPASATLTAPEHWTEEQATALAARIHAGGTGAAHPLCRPLELAAPYEPVSESSVEIALERGPCFGKCPMYALRIRGDGSLSYVGKKYVRSAGEHAATVTRQTIRNLLARFAAVDFYSLPDRTSAMDSDSQSIVLSLSVDGKTKSIEHLYGGGDWGDDPDEVVCEILDALSDAVDYETGSRRWTGPLANEPPVSHSRVSSGRWTGERGVDALCASARR